VREFEQEQIEVAAFSKDGKKVATAGRLGTRYGVTVYDLQGSELVRFDDFTNSINDLAFSPDGNALAVAADKAAWVKRLDTGEAWKIPHPDYVTGVAFSPNGETVATTCWDGLPRLWQYKSKRLIKSYKGHTSRTYSPRFSPDGQWLATASWDGTARIWWGSPNLVEVPVKTLPAREGGLNTVSWSPDGRWLATTGDKALTLWDVKTHRYETDTSMTHSGFTSLLNWEGKAYSLRGGYRGIEASYQDILLGKLEIEFHDMIYEGTFSDNGLYVLVDEWPIGKRAYPFHPQVIQYLVFGATRFGPVK
jgi:WD40 repeat protein